MKVVQSLLVLSILLSLSVISINTIWISTPGFNLQNIPIRVSSYTPHGTISISGNSAFSAQGWPGDGTAESPYIIEGFEIIAQGTCIYIFNTNVHFIIRNCILSSHTNIITNCIRLSHVSNGVIENCTIFDSYMGLVLVGPRNCLFVNNTFTGCDELGVLVSQTENCTFNNNTIMNSKGYGFFVQNSENTTFVSNRISDCSRFGFYITSTANCTFVDNTFENGGFVLVGDLQYQIHDFSDNIVNGKPMGYFVSENDTEIDGNQYGQVFLIQCFNVSLSSGLFFNTSIGISLVSCTNCSVSDVILVKNVHGIDLVDSENITLRNNDLIDCGIRFDGIDPKYWTITEIDNTVNGKPFGYFFNQNDMIINGSDYGQLVLVESEQLSINDGIFDSVTVGVSFHSCFKCSISDAIIVNDYFEGIGIFYSPNCTLTNVIIENSKSGGIYIIESDNVTVAHSRIYGSRYGIWISSSDNYIFDSNRIHDNSEHSLYIRDTFYGTVRNNFIQSNGDALELYVVNYLEIVNNTIIGSKTDGIYMDFTSGVVVIDNRIYGNVGYGLYVGSYALLSEIYNNMIGFNEQRNAIDNGYFNEWDNGAGTGNVWSDYSGTGTYLISGMGVDNYPRGFINRPADVEYKVGASVPPIAWNVRLPDPDFYTMFWNGAVIAHNSLNSSLEHLSKQIGGLGIGSYNLTLLVVNELGYSLVDTVLITVTEESTTTTTTTTTTTSTTTTTTTTTTTSANTETTSTTTNRTTQSDILLIMITVGAGAGVVLVVFLLAIIRKKQTR